MYRVLAALALAACASSPRTDVEAPDASGAGATEEAQSTSGSGALEGSGGTSEPLGTLAPPPPGAQSLPEVALRNVGLHVEGGANDSASKAPFVEAIERAFPDFQRCYRVVDEPGGEGTFAVELHVPSAGGRPRVEQPRTPLSGERFRSCMVRAFEGIAFERVGKPVILRYSVRFSLKN